MMTPKEDKWRTFMKFATRIPLDDPEFRAHRIASAVEMDWRAREDAIVWLQDFLFENSVTQDERLLCIDSIVILKESGPTWPPEAPRYQ